MDLTLHIGAHRTGSTMVERTIAETLAAHPDCGVALWGPRRLRDLPGFQMTTSRLGPANEPVDSASATALDGLASRIAADAGAERARGVRTLILSEENLLGSMRRNFLSGQFYPGVAARLAAFDTLLPAPPHRIALGVRNYGAVWTSAYHYLPQRGKAVPPVGPAKEVLLNDRRGWPDIVQEVHAVWPETPVLMWRQEDLETHLVTICSAITRLPRDMIVVPQGRINARTTATQRPRLFDKDERKHLTHRYNRHLRRMQQRPEVTLIEASR